MTLHYAIGQTYVSRAMVACRTKTKPIQRTRERDSVTCPACMDTFWYAPSCCLVCRGESHTWDCPEVQAAFQNAINVGVFKPL